VHDRGLSRQWHVGRPGNAVTEGVGLILAVVLERSPEGDDVVVDFFLARDLDKVDAAIAPGSAWFDPRARAALVIGFKVLVVGEAAAPLSKAESRQVLHREYADLQPLGVGDRTP